MKKTILTLVFVAAMGLFQQLAAQKMIISGLLIQPQEMNGVTGLSTEYPFILELKQKKNKISGTSFFITPDGNYFVQMHLTGVSSGNKMVLTEDKIIRGVQLPGTYFLKELTIWKEKDSDIVSGSWKDFGSSGVTGTFEGRTVELMPVKK